ncbi:MAG: carboxypeptidase regulatory-like domain-containing protein [Terracidiphilus sp.]
MNSRFFMSRLLILPLMVMMLGLLSLPINAQTFYGSIVGTVTDTSGAVVSNAKATITDIETNEKHTVATDASGNYRFVSLVPADYQVDVETENFKHFSRSGITVQVDTTVRVDAALEIGDVTETMEVTFAAPMLETEQGTLGSSVEGRTVAEMPLNGRNTFNLMELVPGVVPQGSTAGGAALNAGIGSNSGADTSSAAWGNYQIGGGFPDQSSMYIDGASVNILNKNFPGVVPVQDVIQEFKVDTSAVSAEFDRFGGGVVNMTTKSGANAFHGTAYEYLRNNVLNANYFFTSRNGAPRPQWNQNQFGGTVGGPIWKNRAFFFYGWEGVHIRAGVPYQTNIPTPAMQTGVIPEVYSSTGVLKNPKVSDPRGLCTVTHNAGTAAVPGNWTINNLAGCEDPTAATMATFYPNNINNPSNAVDNYYTTLADGTDGYQMSGRVDYNITSSNRLFSRFTFWPLTDLANNYMNNANGWNSANSQHHNHTNQLVVGDTYTFNASTILDIHVDYLRQMQNGVPPGVADGSVNLSQFGSAYTTLAPFMTDKNFPAWSFTGGTQLHNLFNFAYSNVSQVFYNNYHVSGDLSKIIGKHTLKMGAEGLLEQREDVGTDAAPSGSFTFSDDLGGDEWANFLFGGFDKGTITNVKRATTFNNYSGYYVSDTWQALPKLSLNMGFRFNLMGAPTENSNNASVLLPATVDPNTGITGTVGLVASSLYGYRSTLVPFNDAFAPRFGFAYRLTEDTVIRGGYALSYLPNDSQTGAWAGNSPVNSASTINTNTATNFKAGCNTTTPVTCYTLSNPFPATTQYPNGMVTAQGRANANFMYSYIGGSVSAPYPWEPYPRSQSMNVSLGHQFRGELAVTVGGAHTLGAHLSSISNGLDQLSDQYDICGGTAYTTAAQCNGSLLTTAANPAIVYDGVKLPSAYQTYGQTLRPFPAYTNYVNSTAYHGTSSYDALEVNVQKRFKAMGQIGGAYTWSKMITDTDGIVPTLEQESGGSGGNGEGFYQDYNNPKAERSIYSYDVPNRMVANYILNLPFGKGQRFGSGVHGIADKLVSGWSTNGIGTLESGYPLYLNTSGNNLSKFFGAGTIRPNYTAGCAKNVGGSGYSRSLSGATWFNTSCFTLPNTPGLSGPGSSASYGFGNESRTDDAIKSSGVNNWDMSVVKSTSIHDQLALQFRVESFNTFNRVQFAPPVTQADSTQFGQVLEQANSPRLIQGALRLTF